MANEFIARNGFRSQNNSDITGSLGISGSLTISSPPGNSITYIGDSSHYPGLSVINFGATTPTSTNWILRGDQSSAAVNSVNGRFDINMYGYYYSALFCLNYIQFGGSLMIEIGRAHV